MVELTKAQIERASKISTPTLHEAAGRIGALPSYLKPVSPDMKLCGPAYPVRGPACDNLWLHRALYKAARGDIIVFDPSGFSEAGYWGEVMTEAALAAGLGGLVLTGSVRDSDVLPRQGFPIFSAGVCIQGTEKDQGGQGFLGTPLMLGDVLISQGDLVVGDQDGLVVLSPEGLDDILEESERRDAKEVDLIARLRAGERTIDIYGLGEGE
ncbi:MAG: hypothetical protein QNI84_11290 [Henriciella sp.]|nr:hypothetical protein [Henriciella sp.]